MIFYRLPKAPLRTTVSFQDLATLLDAQISAPILFLQEL
ncbi:hypothetical protein X772_28705 [Mesorhizobium sp. LSJC280B00]|nr:hypothetical protein X772_28705 [Mesorhizobium sp. LSJC280B00]